ncbi:MAG TPA: sodium-dependent transporter [Xanthomonadales bacterium]|nr:sodium-dependent transporter [Xanthomonadales bacterium]
MTSFKQHEQWSSRIVFLLSAIGAAVGLGNIWKFPYITGENGGSAFVLVYLLVIAFVAIPILIAEIMLGRRGRQSPPHSVAIIAREEGRSRAWSVVGWLGVLSAYLIMTYYSVIAGWAMSYMFKTGAGDFSGHDAVEVSAAFSTLLADPGRLTLWHAIFMAITMVILVRGLRGGIELAMKLMMPALFFLLLVMVGYAAFEGDMKAGLHFMFDFDFAAINGKVVLMAIGHAFFSIGVAMGLMMGFGAYLGRDISIAKSALIISVMDTVVALLAGIAIFPIVFANGLDPAQGPGLIFVTLPIAFGNMTGGLLFGTLFFILLFFAALTSAIGSLEPVVAWVEEHRSIKRPAAAMLVCGSAFILGMASVFSFNLWSEWHPLGFIDRFAESAVFDLLDYLTANIMMPLGGLLLAVFVGWRVSPEAVAEHVDIRNPHLFRIWFWLLRFVVPVSIAGIFISNL